ncbi:MAG TPA: site-specific integrase, partial [Thalassobaculum sp.]
LKLGDLSGPACQAVRAALLTVYSRTYAGKIFQSFRSALAQSVESGLLAADPAAGMRIVTASRFGADERVEIPTVAQMQAILRTAAECRQWSTGQRSDGNVRAAWRRYHRLILLAVFSGLRPSEQRGLAWPQVDLDAGKVSVVQRADQYGVIGAVKTANAVRDVQLPRTVVDELRAWRLECPLSPGHLVFPSAQGNPLPLENIHRRAWRPLLERAGIVDAEDVPLFTYYATRHFYASALIAQHVQEGMSREAMALAIRDAMGHATVTFTLQVYGHLFPKDDAAGKAQAAALEATLLGPAAAAIVDDGKPDDVPGLSQRDKKISYIKAVG